MTRRGGEPSRVDFDSGVDRIRIELPEGWIRQQAGESMEMVHCAAKEFRSAGTTLCKADLDEAETGRAAAYLITNSESAAFHLDRLRSRADDFDPETRDRFLAGALTPAPWPALAQRVRAWWLRAALELFQDVDVILVPATPVEAPLLGQKQLALNGMILPLRPTFGLLAQPFSCIGLTVATVPIFSAGALPRGLQIVVSPWKEALALTVARMLESTGLACAHPPARNDCS